MVAGKCTGLGNTVTFRWADVKQSEQQAFCGGISTVGSMLDCGYDRQQGFVAVEDDEG